MNNGFVKSILVAGRKLLMATLSNFILPFMIDKAIAQKMVLIMQNLSLAELTISFN
jgi:hypothetical protein